jgi:hypothetical protein
MLVGTVRYCCANFLGLFIFAQIRLSISSYLNFCKTNLLEMVSKKKIDSFREEPEQKCCSPAATDFKTESQYFFKYYVLEYLFSRHKSTV